MKTKIITALAALALVLTGCSAAAAPVHSTPKATTTKQAADEYMALVCPANATAYLLTFAYDTKDPAKIRAAATNAWRVVAHEAQRLNDTTRWPAPLRSDLRTLSIDMSVYSAYYVRVANAGTYDAMLAVPHPMDTAGGPAAADLRVRLHLPVIDPKTSCDSTPLVVHPTPQTAADGAVNVALP